MPKWFRRRNAKKSDSTENESANRWLNSAIQLQLAYWSYDPDEKAALLARYPDALSWSEILRLHHLTCLELLSSKQGNAQLMDVSSGDIDAPQGASYKLCQALTQRLMSQNSPYRTRNCFVWQGDLKQVAQQPPDLQGKLRNASLTHVGCLEVMRLDQHNQPKELSFIPFDDIRAILFDQPSFFRAARIVYEDASEEIVYLPLLYGVSWLTENEYDHNGTRTRFRCLVNVDGINMGMGIGHQDFSLTEFDSEGSSQIFGLGSLAKLISALELSDPKFDEKCVARGLDPATVRQEMRGSGN